MRQVRLLLLIVLICSLNLAVLAPTLAQTDTPAGPSPTTPAATAAPPTPFPAPAPTPPLTIEGNCFVYGPTSPECLGSAWRLFGEGAALLVVIAVVGLTVATAYLKGRVIAPIEDLGRKHAGAKTAATTLTPFETVTREYLEAVFKDFQVLKFRGVRTRARELQVPTLQQAYVSLLVSGTVVSNLSDQSKSALSRLYGSDWDRKIARGWREGANDGNTPIRVPMVFFPEPHKLYTALVISRKLAIIGAAGSGKSTLLQWAGLAAAAGALGLDLSTEQQRLVAVLGKARLPLLLPLREFIQYCRERHLPCTHNQLLNYLAIYTREKHHIDLPLGFFERHLKTGCLFMFDGVDEVPAPDRQSVREAIDALVRANDLEINCFMLSSRSTAYVDETQVRDFATCTVLPMQKHERDQLILGWYRANFAPEEAERKAGSLKREIDNGDKRVRDLAVTPLMVTVFAILHLDERELPRQRAEFYERAIEVLLTEKYKEGEAARVMRDDWATRRDHLALIAYTLHSLGVESLLEDDLLEQPTLWKGFGAEKEPAQEAARAFLERVARRGGLLEENSGRYGFFTHRTFQEFLAGRHLAEELGSQWDALLSAHLNDDAWEEVLRLACGYLAIAGRERANAFLLRLSSLGIASDDRARAHTLGCLALSDLPPDRIQPEVERSIVQQTMALLFANPAIVPIRERYALGISLAMIGDPRFKVHTDRGLVPTMVPIPGGRFLMGTSPQDVETLNALRLQVHTQVVDFVSSGELPAHWALVSDFEIGRYPVTNAEFRCFVRANGYDNPSWWSPEGWLWRQGDDTVLLSGFADSFYASAMRFFLKSRPVEARGQPDLRSGPIGTADNLPVSGVTWYEADAYCRWLSDITGQFFRLPREAEWERTARGPAATIWPWGQSIDTTSCNTAHSGIDRATSVGLFPHGAAAWPGGPVEDLSGNVSEWCGDWYDSYSDQIAPVLNWSGPATGHRRVQRGGSYAHAFWLCRAACREGQVPASSSQGEGFRLVRSLR